MAAAEKAARATNNEVFHYSPLQLSTRSFSSLCASVCAYSVENPVIEQPTKVAQVVYII